MVRTSGSGLIRKMVKTKSAPINTGSKNNSEITFEPAGTPSRSAGVLPGSRPVAAVVAARMA